MDTFFNSPGNPNVESTEALLNGNAPINSEANITVNGTINAIESVKLDTGSINVKGQINAGTSAEDDLIEAQDIVNTGSYSDASSINFESGKIILKGAGNIEISGTVNTEGADNINGGNIDIISEADIVAEKRF